MHISLPKSFIYINNDKLIRILILERIFETKLLERKKNDIQYKINVF